MAPSLPLVAALDRRAVDPHPGASLSLRARRIQHSPYFSRRFSLDRKLQGHDGCVNTVVWSASGHTILSGSDDCCLNIWRPDAPQPLVYSIRSGHMTNIFSAKWLSNTDERHVISCSADGVVRFTNLDDFVHKSALQNWTPGNPFRCHAGMTYEVTPEPADPHVFFDCSEDGTVNSYDLREKSWCDCRGDCRRHVLIDVGRGSRRRRTRRFAFLNTNPEVGVTAISIRPDFPAHLALACADDTVAVYDRRFSGRPPSGSGHPSRPKMIYSFIPNSMRPEPNSSPASPSVAGNRNRAAVRHRIPHKITSLKYDPCGGGDLLVSYSREKLFLIRPCGLDGGSRRSGGGGDVGGGGGYRLKRANRSSESSSSFGGLDSTATRKRVARRGSGETSTGSSTSRRKPRGRDYWKRRERSAERSSSRTAENGVMHSSESVARSTADSNSDTEGGGTGMALGSSGRHEYFDNSPRRQQTTSVSSKSAFVDPATRARCNGEARSIGDPKMDRETTPAHPAWAMPPMATSPFAGRGSESSGSTMAEVEPSAPSERDLQLNEMNDRGSSPPIRVGILTIPNEDSLSGDSDESDEEDYGSNDDDGGRSGNLPHLNWRSTESVSDDGDDYEEDFEQTVYDLARSAEDGAGSESEEEQRSCARGGNDHVVHTYHGHRNEHTMIKEANFFGPRSEYVMSGSDDGRIFVWEKHSTRIVNVMKGDSKVVNCIQPHPHLPVLATSGIDDDIKIWHPSADGPPDLSDLEEIIRQNEVISGGALGAAAGRTIVLPANILLQMLGAMLMD